MRFVLSAIALLYVLTSNGTALGQTMPDAVLTFNEKDSERLVDDLRDLQTLRTVNETQTAEIEALKKQLVEKDNAIADLKDAFAKESLAMALAEDREKRRQDIENEYKGVLDSTKQLIADQNALLKDMMAQNKSLQRELFWTRILGPLSIVGAFAGGLFMH